MSDEQVPLRKRGTVAKLPMSEIFRICGPVISIGPMRFVQLPENSAASNLDEPSADPIGEDPGPSTEDLSHE